MATKPVKKKKTPAAKPARKQAGRSLTRAKSTKSSSSVSSRTSRSRTSILSTITRSASHRSASRPLMFKVAGLSLLAVVAIGITQYHRVTQSSGKDSVESSLPKSTSLSEYKINSKLLSKEFQKTQTLDLPSRIAFWSEFIERNPAGRKKLLSLVKKVEINDIAPIVPKKYNCTTFVETVSALARSQNANEFIPNLLKMRYKEGQPSFANRNHFPEVDWIPNNEKAAILTDITKKVAQESGLNVKTETKEIFREAWLKAQAKALGPDRAFASVSEKSDSNAIHAQVNYVEIAQIKQALDYLPNGAIVNLVHKNDGRHPVLITHQGFIIRDHDRVLLRHASLSGHIRTNDFYKYLQDRIREQRPHTQWPLVGINLNQINRSTSANSRFSESM